MKFKFIIPLLFLFQNISFGQDCNVTVIGYVFDQGTKIPLELSNVYLEDTGKGAVSDERGYFKIENICPAEYHIQISHLGCATEELFINVTKDTFIEIFLSHHSEFIDEIEVHGRGGDGSTSESTTINRTKITEESSKNLSDILENITGVSVLKNGSGISKPVVHGLFGNRVAILNNGISQAGQQWGNDHAPEIDPFVADHLSVIKGASALAYGSNSLGSVVLVEVDEISSDPHLHGEINYTFETNGLGNTLNSMIEKKGKWASWRLTGTLKRQGDTRAPDYFLTNTGKRENNFALQLEKSLSEKWKTDFYYSVFNSTIGILQGSHIGNLTDLDQAIGRDKPFFTKDEFSYNITLPRQEVTHHLVKVESKYLIDDENFLKFKYGGQLNNRKEFDRRRGDLKSRPALNLSLYSNFGEVVYNKIWATKLFLKTGYQFEMVDNNNIPGTGISPLIPNYRSFQNSAFFILQNDNSKKWLFEYGGRFSFKKLTVKTFDNSPPNDLLILKHNFQNFASSAGVRWRASDFFQANFNLGLMQRAPEVNELYSFGLHQGVSGIEEGASDLRSEQSMKALLSLDYRVQEKLFVQALSYFQRVNNFIFLEPQKEFRLTIRGAFPVFIYKQTNANIAGMDFLVKYEPQKNWSILTKYSMVRGYDLTNDIGLINMPSDNIYSSMTYTFFDKNQWKNNFITINTRFVFQQNRITDDQDFLIPPNSYFLLGLQVGTSFEMKESKLKIGFRVENLLNENYRDYLNRLRYFADETGINVSLNMNYSF